MRQAPMVATLVLLTAALYARTARFDYVRADDSDLIPGNISFLSDVRNIPEAFSRSYFEVDASPSDRKTYYRPLVIASFILDAQWSGANPRGYHVTNVAIHAAAVLLLFAFMRGLVATATPAFVSALLFAVHPANTQAVCWIPGRNDTLMACFALLSLIGLAGYLNSDRGASPRRTPLHARSRGPLLPRSARVAHSLRSFALRHGRAGALVLHLGGFAAALFTKETALALAPLFVLYAVLWSDRGRRLRRHHALLVAYAAIVAGWYVARRAALAGGGESSSALEYVQAAARNAPDLLVYGAKLVLPVRLSVMPGLTSADAVLGAASLVVVAWVLWRVAPAKRWFVIGWMLLFIVPGLGVPGLPAYEHRLYFPLMALMLAISMLPVWAAAEGRRRAMLAAAVVVAASATRTTAHAGVFRDPYAYWTSATVGSPHAGIAHVNLGQLYEADGDLGRAADQYQRALAADPRTPGANNNLGVLLARRGELETARAYFEREVQRHPANADAHFNLGLVDKLSGRIDEAAASWQRAIAAEPGHAAAHQELADYYAAKGDTARAARHAKTARE